MTETGSTSPGETEFCGALCRRLGGHRLGGSRDQAAVALFVDLDETLREWRTKLPSKEEVLGAVGVAYDRFIAPIDLPWVPNIIEPMVDSMLRRYLLSAVDQLYDRLVGV